MPNFFKDEKGFAPLLLLVILAVGLVAGGSYVVKNNLVTTKNGQIVFNANKDKDLSDIKIPSPQPDTNKATPTPKKVELAEKTAEYKSNNTDEPQFSISPPAGWVKGKTEDKIKIRFDAPQEDKQEINNTNASIGANIQVYVEKTSAKSLDEAMSSFKDQASKLPVSIDFQNERKTTFGGVDALYFEMLISMPNLDYKQLESYVKQQSSNGKTPSTQDIKDMMQSFKGKSIGYTMLKNGYRVDVGGTAAGWAWDKRSGAIQSSINTFKFLDDTLTDNTPKTPSPTQKPPFSNSWTNATNVFPDKEAPIKFTMIEPSGWKKSVPNTANEKDYSLFLEGNEESETGKGGTVLKIKPGIYIDMRYRPSTTLEEQIKINRTSTPTLKIISEKPGTFFGETGYFMESTDTDYKTGLLIKGQGYTFYKDKYVINISSSSLQSTWDKWYPVMKEVIDSFKFQN
ncbi:hypothetical protein M1437_01565 [Patescibacteria group bacterium]|nr:hypothetical protein [Patescibacteria group bacterium]